MVKYVRVPVMIFWIESSLSKHIKITRRVQEHILLLYTRDNTQLQSINRLKWSIIYCHLHTHTHYIYIYVYIHISVSLDD